MAKKLTYVEIRNLQDTIQHRGNSAPMAYMLGAYESLIASIVAYDLPAHKQKEFVRSLESLRERVAQITS